MSMSANKCIHVYIYIRASGRHDGRCGQYGSGRKPTSAQQSLHEDFCFASSTGSDAANRCTLYLSAKIVIVQRLAASLPVLDCYAT